MSRSRHFFCLAAGLLGLLVQAPPTFAGDCLTADCHQALTAREYPHEPVVAEDCLACHEQTAAGHPSPAGKNFTLALSGASLCLQCHEAEQKDRLHPPVEAGECLGCHDPHGSAAVHLLKMPIPELCYECHDAIRDEVKAKVRHAAVYRQDSCSICHSGHSSSRPALLLAGEQELCLSCHGQDDYTRSVPLRNIGSEIDGKPYLHGPLADGECSPCHNPHGSPYSRLLRANYPEGVYADYSDESYALCFECHDNAMMRTRNASADTAFRSGTRNLHYLHLAGLRKGRICTSCHASHASSNARLLKDNGTRFGDWTIPVNFKATDTGGSCAPGCHQATDYDRSQP